jgi:hypothetical protein
MNNAEDISRFLHLVRYRMEKGAEAYGDASFERHPPELLEEILEELADVCGWSAVLASRIYALQRKVKDLK